MKALVVGGTGVIGTGVVNALLRRGGTVTVHSRGLRGAAQGPRLVHVAGDRHDAASFEGCFEGSRFDVVIDLTCFGANDAESAVRAFGGRCEHFVFCSTVCTYGVKVPPGVLVDETFPQEPLTDYGRGKVSCERILEKAAQSGAFELTIVRPSHTYGPGGPLLDQLEIDGVAWDRIARGLPIFCAGDGLGLWQATHRDDVAKVFALAALNPRAYGESYNATGDQVVTWRDYHGRIASVLGRPAELVFAPAAWLLRAMPGRLGFLETTSQFHGAYSSAKARTHLPGSNALISLEDGARETLADLGRRGALRASDELYDRALEKALKLGFPCVMA
jgi:nucleoside-diphosphate-sugar epimerase